MLLAKQGNRKVKKRLKVYLGTHNRVLFLYKKLQTSYQMSIKISALYQVKGRYKVNSCNAVYFPILPDAYSSIPVD